MPNTELLLPSFINLYSKCHDEIHIDKKTNTTTIPTQSFFRSPENNLLLKTVQIGIGFRFVFWLGELESWPLLFLEASSCFRLRRCISNALFEMSIEAPLIGGEAGAESIHISKRVSAKISKTGADSWFFFVRTPCFRRTMKSRRSGSGSWTMSSNFLFVPLEINSSSVENYRLLRFDFRLSVW